MQSVVISPEDRSWDIQNLPMPDPATNQVLIRIRASGLYYNDLHQRCGTPGHEAAGEIVAVGPGVRDRKVGDRVGVLLWQGACGRCEWCRRGRPLFCADKLGTSMQLPGSHAEFMLAYAQATVLIPDALSFEQAAPVFCAGYTACAGLRAAVPKPGERVAVVGIGGLGHMAVQYARDAGLYTIALSRSPDKDPLIRKLGADEIVRSGAELSAVGGADIILATGSSSAAQADAIQGLRPMGRLVVMGLESKPLEVSTGALVAKRARIIGSQHNDRESLYRALDLAARGRVKAMVEPYGLTEVDRARERLLEGSIRFRAVVVM